MGMMSLTLRILFWSVNRYLPNIEELLECQTCNLKNNITHKHAAIIAAVKSVCIILQTFFHASQVHFSLENLKSQWRKLLNVSLSRHFYFLLWKWDRKTEYGYTYHFHSQNLLYNSERWKDCYTFFSRGEIGVGSTIISETKPWVFKVW